MRPRRAPHEASASTVAPLWGGTVAWNSCVDATGTISISRHGSRTGGWRLEGWKADLRGRDEAAIVPSMLHLAATTTTTSKATGIAIIAMTITWPVGSRLGS